MFYGRTVATLLLLYSTLCVGCNSTPQSQATSAEVTPDPRLATPHTMLPEEPLQGALARIPDVWVATSRQSKLALVQYLYQPTGPEETGKILQQLEWVNPGLDDPVLPGTMVVIPPVYRVTQSESLSAVARTVGLSEDLMRAINPKFDEQDVLDEGTLVVLPSLYVVPQDTLLSAAANALQISDEALISANPELATQDEILAGDVLIVPPRQEDGHE